MSFQAQNAGEPWSYEVSGDVSRFEVRSGDHAGGDGPTKERSEIADTSKLQFDQTYDISFSAMVEPGAPNTASWLTLAQIQSTPDAGEAGHSPLFAIEMVGEEMRIVSRSSSAAISTTDNTTYTTQYTDSTPITRGQWYDFDIQIKIDAFGNGELEVTRDGVVLVDYHGAIGFNDLVGSYWKEGVYRASSPETLAADYKDLTITEVQTPPVSPPPVPTLPSLGFTTTAVSHSEGASGTTAFAFTVTRTGDLDAASSASWSVAGSGAHAADAHDFAGGVLPSGTVDFAAGQASAVITVNVAADTAVEPDEGFTVTLASPNAATLGAATATGTIVNDDAPASPPPASPPPSSPPPSSPPPSSPSGPSSSSTPTVMHDIAMDGSATNDVITAGGGDSVRGLDGDDTITGFGVGNLINGNQGNDVINGGPGADTLYGGQGTDTVYGGGGQQLINGNLGDDIIHGGPGGDTLYGGQGADTIYGGAGADTLSGDLGNDILYGGAGADRFIFHAGGGHDWIADFNAAEGDRIVLDPGQSYTVSSYQGQAMVTLSDGSSIGLVGVSPADMGDWLSYA